MNSEPDKTVCPRDDIAAYLDGELSSLEASALDEHLGTCTVCSSALCEQRQFLAALSASFSDEPGVGFPPNFATTVIATAENRVTGLRSPHEQFTAFFIATALLFFSLIALGSGLGEIAKILTVFGERVFTVAFFCIRILSNLLAAAAVVVRALFAGSAEWVYFATFALIFASSTILIRQLYRSGQVIARN